MNAALRRTALVFAVGSLAAAARVPPAQGQVRGWVGTTVQAVEMRPVRMDTIPFGDVSVDAVGDYVYQGRPVSCIVNLSCFAYRALDEVTAVAATYDLNLTAWGFGVQGLSATALLRARGTLGGEDFVWPRADDEFDLMLGYVQWIRGGLRVRAGRQEVRSGLGFPVFDGGSLAFRVSDVLLEAYAGRSLARGLRDPANEALRSLESYLPDQGVRLFGGSARARWQGMSFTARYHRELLADRSGIEAERASLDFSTVVPNVRFSGSIDYDFAFERWGKGHVTLAVPLAEGKWMLEASALRYVPYFSLSTIWGFFEPVAYESVEARLGWSPSKRLAVWASGGKRFYEDAGAAVVLRPLEDQGWRADAGVTVARDDAWTVNGRYGLEWGPGGYLSSGDLTVRWAPSPWAGVSVSGTSFQQIEQFRVGDGRAYGASAALDLALGDRTTLLGGVSVLRHSRDGGAVDSPWNQTRAWTSLRIGVGKDPGLEGLRGERRGS